MGCEVGARSAKKSNSCVAQLGFSGFLFRECKVFWRFGPGGWLVRWGPLAGPWSAGSGVGVGVGGVGASGGVAACCGVAGVLVALLVRARCRLVLPLCVRGRSSSGAPPACLSPLLLLLLVLPLLPLPLALGCPRLGFPFGRVSLCFRVFSGFSDFLLISGGVRECSRTPARGLKIFSRRF